MSDERRPVIARTRQELDDALREARASGPVALVPTMGALHDGHVRLLEHAATRGGATPTVVASIFVNPTQFGAGEDFGVYPRSFDADLRRCAEAGVSVVFAPEIETMYPGGTGGITVDPGPLGSVLEGASRPTHFRGVLTVVAKLFGLVRPDVAVFGEKDYQQLALITAMTQTLCLPTEIVGCPTVREPDGLAMSSRNGYLDAAEHEVATALSRALRAGAAESGLGAEAVLKAADAVLASEPGLDLDYLALADPDLGMPVTHGPARLLVAAGVGRTRLIDNTGLTLGVLPDSGLVRRDALVRR